jgi:hypothetical protein
LFWRGVGVALRFAGPQVGRCPRFYLCFLCHAWTLEQVQAASKQMSW